MIKSYYQNYAQMHYIYTLSVQVDVNVIDYIEGKYPQFLGARFRMF